MPLGLPPRARDESTSPAHSEPRYRRPPAAAACIRVAIVGDASLYRRQLEQSMDATTDVRCIYAGDDEATALREIPPQAPHVILVGPSAAKRETFDCIVRLREVLANAEFLVFAIEPNGDVPFRAFAAGATGCLSHRTPPEQVLAAVRDVHGGGAPLSPDIAARVVGHFRQRRRPMPEARLSERQARILGSMARGLAASQIATEMGLSPETVRSYLKLIYRKLRVHNRTEAVMRYFGRPIA